LVLRVWGLGLFCAEGALLGGKMGKILGTGFWSLGAGAMGRDFRLVASCWERATTWGGPCGFGFGFGICFVRLGGFVLFGGDLRHRAGG